MPRYFFNVVDGTRERDQEGLELPDLNSARKAAVSFAGGVLRDEPDMIWDGRDFRIDVTDENEMSVLIVITMAIDAEVVWPSENGVRRDPYKKPEGQPLFLD